MLVRFFSDVMSNLRLAELRMVYYLLIMQYVFWGTLEAVLREVFVALKKLVRLIFYENT